MNKYRNIKKKQTNENESGRAWPPRQASWCPKQHIFHIHTLPGSGAILPEDPPEPGVLGYLGTGRQKTWAGVASPPMSPDLPDRRELRPYQS